MTTKLYQLSTYIKEMQGKRKEVYSSLSSAKIELSTLKKDLVKHEQAKEVLKIVGLDTQKQLQYHISDIASLALNSIFEDPYELVLEFLERRDKTECDIVFVKDGEKLDPMDSSGGGAVDIAAFALRIASWSMQNPHTRNTIVLDEPMKNLSAEYKEKGSEMLKQVSQKLGIQFIIINHDPTLTSMADRTIRVEKKKRYSKVQIYE